MKHRNTSEAKTSQGFVALELLAEMDRIHLQPDLITFATAITACERSCILAL